MFHMMLVEKHLLDFYLEKLKYFQLVAPTLKEQGYDVQFVNWRGFFAPKSMSMSDYNKISKMLGDVQKTPEWEAVRKRNAWVNIYNPGSKFDAFLEKQTVEMTALMKKLGVI